RGGRRDGRGGPHGPRADPAAGRPLRRPRRPGDHPLGPARWAVSLFIIEVTTAEGKRRETFATYEEAVRRIEQLTREAARSLPPLFQELPDGSQRGVRKDGKPIQWHRLPDDTSLGLAVPTDDVPLPLEDVLPGEIRPASRPPQDDEDDEPLPLLD